MKLPTTLSALMIGFCWLVSAGAFEANPCVRNSYGKVACPPQGGLCLVNSFGVIACSPPFGGIVATYNGGFLCGPGQCLMPAFGRPFCSSEMFGSAMMQPFGDPVCTGRCIPASPEACLWP